VRITTTDPYSASYRCSILSVHRSKYLRFQAAQQVCRKFLIDAAALILPNIELANCTAATHLMYTTRSVVLVVNTWTIPGYISSSLPYFYRWPKSVIFGLIVQQCLSLSCCGLETDQDIFTICKHGVHRWPGYVLAKFDTDRLRVFTALHWMQRPYVCLSVRPSNSCIVTKWKHLANKVQLWLIGSQLWAFQWAQDEQCTLRLCPQWGLKTQIDGLPYKNWAFLEESLLESFFLWKLSAAKL